MGTKLQNKEQKFKIGNKGLMFNKNPRNVMEIIRLSLLLMLVEHEIHRNPQLREKGHKYHVHATRCSRGCFEVRSSCRSENSAYYFRMQP